MLPSARLPSARALGLPWQHYRAELPKIGHQAPLQPPAAPAGQAGCRGLHSRARPLTIPPRWKLITLLLILYWLTSMDAMLHTARQQTVSLCRLHLPASGWSLLACHAMPGGGRGSQCCVAAGNAFALCGRHHPRWHGTEDTTRCDQDVYVLGVQTCRRPVGSGACVAGPAYAHAAHAAACATPAPGRQRGLRLVLQPAQPRACIVPVFSSSSPMAPNMFCCVSARATS